MTKTIQPELTLVGAGIGDPDLITMKGIKALRRADVVLYDALVCEELLEYAPQAKKIYVGKRVGQHSFKQEEINRLIVSNAFGGGHVVRLKGGDPFVFGRGHEEMVYAQEHGIRVNLVPGISSSVAAPALQGIPVTRRGDSQSFWVITGTTKEGEVSKDIALAAQSSATVIILMGTKKIDQIMDSFTAAGKEDTPVAIIQHASTPHERIGLGNVHTIADIMREKGLGSPAVIVVGEVVKHHAQYPKVLSEVVANATVTV
ncbi:uroporphyrinogen-III C-methyltransferase [Flammeovirga kamogawensis]|uniref:uroporphyrinogen-III C-methyltransferase n=1 Tax=Flammeovirga kamogawensis TaxID=373891 RepID=A0ABX8GZ84_9BACT|nr:uroporphyrinogen-III C-methyltransferase [Flammeovirga kamogawensis]MBB6459013.1 uroporphyrin-III C-methyltransferase [Flammeovirga kamogawensis]QWG08586.1 uroporphyrinogen-III C-methyltransferase [Flammeovirga kamogawensis]TRX66878.1 uroporphyrinogen-III C-methyltransferase [Flammeovirga kamogawensis]